VKCMRRRAAISASTRKAEGGFPYVIVALQQLDSLAHSVYFDMPDPAFGIQFVYNQD